MCFFFEKLRIAEGKPKSKHRQDMEAIWASKGGFNITRGHHRGYVANSFSLSLSFVLLFSLCRSVQLLVVGFCGHRYYCIGDEKPVQDQFGRVQFVK